VAVPSMMQPPVLPLALPPATGSRSSLVLCPNCSCHLMLCLG
jgi:hypothetical protein